MAVIDGLPEIKVSIRINGSEEDCTEYDDPDPPKSASSPGSATHTISKVIESQVDAGFLIHLEIRNRQAWINGNNWLAFNIHIDGQYITTYYRGPGSLVNQTIVLIADGFWDTYRAPGKKIRRHFNFASPKTVEGSNVELSRNQIIPEHVGIIEVAVFRVKFEGRKPRTLEEPWKVEDLGDVSEMALKGKSISHSTSFTEGIRIDAKKTRKTFSERDKGQKIARFFFRYKPKSSLQVDGIIPRDPSPEPSPLPPARSVAHLPLEDIMRLAQERLEQLEPQVKREPGISVKREADEETDSRPRKIYKMDADGTIDLSDD